MSHIYGFLRAVNVGGRRITMVELAATLRDAELSNPETFIASGNFVFTGEGSASAIEATMVTKLGFCSEVYLRNRDEMLALVEHAGPLAAQAGVHATYVGFLKAPPNAALRERLAIIENPQDNFSFAGQDLIWTAYGPNTETPFGKKGLGGRIKGGQAWPPITWRNVKTLQRMLAKWD